MPYRVAPRALGLAACVFVGLLGVLGACTSEAVAVSVCRKVEEARCDRAIECEIDLRRLGSAADVDGCKRFYRDACLHGIVPAEEPAGTAVDQCVAAIATASCVAVNTPVLLPECRWLGAPPPVEDAGSDADADADAS